MPNEVLSPEKSEIKGTPKTADDINELFSSIDDETPAKEPTEKKEPKEVKEEPEEGDTLDLIEPTEEAEKLDLSEKDENLDIEVPPRKKEILKEYPELFKKFPFLEKMMYRDREYNELFGSFDDAKEIAEKSEIFAQFESQLLSGDTEEILRNVKDVDVKAFNHIVDEYLPTLAKVDKEAYFHVTGNLNKRLIMEMVKEANDTNNDDLKQAALLVNQFVFGTSKFTSPTRLTEETKLDDKASEQEQERLSFVKERFESVRDDLQGQVDNTLKATISEYIDPRNTMSAYVKKNAVNDALKYVIAAIANDPSVAKNLDKLWRASFDDKFSRDSQGRIKSYYLGKARANLKSAILKARSEALKDNRPDSRTKETDSEETESETKTQRRIIPGRTSQPKSGKNEIKKGESVTDYFMRD